MTEVPAARHGCGAELIELFRALGALSEPPGPETARLAELLQLGGVPTAAEYTDLFTLQLYPYASVYTGEDGMLGGEARDRVAGFWRALGEAPPPEPDHLAVLLALYARLAEAEAAPRHVRAALLWEHLLSWLWPYLDKVEEIAPPAYASWGGLLRRALLAEAESLEPPNRLPLHLRDAPPPPDPAGAERDAVLGALLAPVRSGIILARRDLSRAARELGLGLRIGERKFMLGALLDQAPRAALRWLRSEAERWATWHEGHRAALGDVAAFWQQRATATACWVGEIEAG